MNARNFARNLFAVAIIASAVSAQAIEARVASSMYHSVFVDNGNVHAMGLNNYHQTNFNTTVVPSAAPQTSTESVLAPVYTGVQNVRSVAANGNRTVALTNAGEMLLWGNLTGTTMVRPYAPFAVTVSDVALSTTALYFVVDGWLYSWDFVNPATIVSSSNNVVSVAAGDRHAVALLNNGTIATLGTNQYGQLGRGTAATTSTSLVAVDNVTGVVEIAVGSTSTFARTADGRVFGFGRNTSGQLGLNNTVNQFAPVVLPVTGVRHIAANFAATFLHMNDNSVRAAGFHDYIGGSVYTTSRVFVTLPGVVGALNVAAGGQQTFVDFGTVGVVRGLGGNSFGQLGDTTRVERNAFTYAYYTRMPAYVAPVAPVAGTCGSIYSNPFGRASNSNNNGAACRDNGNHNGARN